MFMHNSYSNAQQKTVLGFKHTCWGEESKASAQYKTKQAVSDTPLR